MQIVTSYAPPCLRMSTTYKLRSSAHPFGIT